jgi:hypothetical protein
MLKRRSGFYGLGRTKGKIGFDSFKWKIPPLSVDAVIIYAQRGHGIRSGLYSDYTFGVINDEKNSFEIVPFTKAYSGLTSEELKKVDKKIKKLIEDSFGPVKKVKPEIVVELNFDSIALSKRHKSGVAVRFPRMKRLRFDKKVEEIDRLSTLKKFIIKTMIIYGVDFSSAPTKQKPIVIAECQFDSCNNRSSNQSSLLLKRFVLIYSLNDFESFLSKSKFGVGGFDLPFSMPEELIEYFEWPNEWETFVRYFCGQSKPFLKECFKSWCEKRDFGKKFAYRLTDIVSKSSPAMRWVNPPVAWMMHAGMHRLINAGLIFPAHDRRVSNENRA